MTLRSAGREKIMNGLPGEAPEVIFIRFSSLGDVILTLPALRGLRVAYPRARISYLTKSAYAPLLEGSPDIERVISLEDLPGRGSLAGIARFCRRERFDLVVDLHGNLRSRVTSLFLRAPVKLRYRKEAMMRRLWASGWMRGKMTRGTGGVVDRYLDTIRPLGVEGEGLLPEIPVSVEAQEQAKAFLRGRGVRAPEKMAVIFPGAKWPNKCWPATGFAALGRWLASEPGFEVVLAGDEGDREQVEVVKRNLSREAAEICGCTGLRELAAILSLAKVVVGNDSGPGHLAAAVGTPVVTIFGPTSEAFGFSPRGKRVRTVSRSLECRPCSIHGGRRCPRGRRSCLDDISPGEVMQAVREVTEG
jgi:heptosyltransferase-2